MASKRLHLTLSLAQYKELQKLAERLGMDMSNAIRHCIATALAIDRQSAERPERDNPKDR